MPPTPVVDALIWVRARPTLFFNREAPEPVQLLAWIVADVVELGGGECVIRKVDAWYVIGSNVNWLAHDAYGELELFQHVVSAPGHGAHSMRGEVLVSAFARDVTVVSSAHVLAVQGQTPPSAVLELARGMERAVVFRVDEPK